MLDLAATLAAALIAAPPAWGLSTPAPEGLDEVAPEAAADGGDHARVTFALAPGVRADDVAARWRADFDAAGWRVVDVADDAWSFTATFERDGLRALTVLDWALAFPPATAATARARGLVEVGRAPLEGPDAAGTRGPSACEPVPVRGFRWYVHSRAVDQHGELRAGSVPHARSSRAAVDLDGDLVLDWLVPVAEPPPACPEDVRWEVWLVRPSGAPALGAPPHAADRCGRRLGVIGPGDLDGEAWRAPKDHGLRRLATERQRSRLEERPGQGVLPALVRETRVARFDGATYRDDGPTERASVCHHCATWTCSPPEPLPPAAPAGAPGGGGATP